MSTSRAKIAILGLGDLGCRIALGMANTIGDAELIVVGRRYERGAAFARLVAGCAETSVRFVLLDALDMNGLTEFILREKPTLIVQCASMLSPWALFERTDILANAFRSAGFALQLSAQLPIITTLMRAIQAARHACPVVNCSYPDVTHPILERLGLAPTIGVGNAGMVLGLVKATLAEVDKSLPIRVIAHHAHVGAAASSTVATLKGYPAPRIFLGQEEIPADSQIFGAVPIPLTRELNALTAAHAVRIICAFLPRSKTVYTSAPGPKGLPGGWPVKISEAGVSIDLPDCVQFEDVIQYQEKMAHADGVNKIANDGTVYLTDEVIASLPVQFRVLGEPLHPDQAIERYRLLSSALGGNNI